MSTKIQEQTRAATVTPPLGTTGGAAMPGPAPRAGAPLLPEVPPLAIPPVSSSALPAPSATKAPRLDPANIVLAESRDTLTGSSEVASRLADRTGDSLSKLEARVQAAISKPTADNLASLRSLVGSSVPITKAILPALSALVGAPAGPQRVAIAQVMNALCVVPAPLTYRTEIKQALSTLTPSDRSAVIDRLQAMKISLPPLASDAHGPEDASSRIRMVHMAGSGDMAHKAYVRDMMIVAYREGFKISIEVAAGTSLDADFISEFEKLGYTAAQAHKVIETVARPVEVETVGSVWSEDNKQVTDKRVLSLPVLADGVDAAVRAFCRGNKGDVSEGSHAVANESLAKEFGLRVGSASSTEPEQVAVYAKAAKKSVVVTRTYVEGGNQLIGTRKDGAQYMIIGRDSLVASVFQLTANKAPEFSEPKLRERLVKLSPSPAAIAATQVKLKAAGLDASDDAARLHLAKEAIAAEIIAQEWGIAPSDLTIVPQPDFHIDMHLRPLGPSQVLLHDDAECVKVLDAALASLPADSKERPTLVSMRAEAQAKATLMAPVTAAIRAALEAQGIKVVLAPGVFDGKDGNGIKRSANFMNAVPGTAAGTVDRFYATNFSPLPSLRNAWERFIKQHGVDRVHYVGVSEGPGLSPAEESLDAMGGLDCRENHYVIGKGALLPNVG